MKFSELAVGQEFTDEASGERFRKHSRNGASRLSDGRPHPFSPEEQVWARREYAFDVTMLATIRVKADNLKQARAMLHEALDCASANFGAWPDGTPIVAEASIEGDADLFEVDGEPV